MLNIDKIKEMSSSELSKLLIDRCKMCAFQYEDCGHDRCTEGVEKWLNEESEITLDKVVNECEAFCNENNCVNCKYNYKVCDYEFILDNFNFVDGKITRRNKGDK